MKIAHDVLSQQLEMDRRDHALLESIKGLLIQNQASTAILPGSLNSIAGSSLSVQTLGLAPIADLRISFQPRPLGASEERNSTAIVDTRLRLKTSGEIIDVERPDIPRVTTVRDALLQWYQAGPHPQHLFALRDWPDKWVGQPTTKEDHRIQVLYGQQRLLSSAYSSSAGIDVYTEGGFSSFTLKYPQKSLTRLIRAIRTDLKDSGVLKGRQRRLQSDDSDDSDPDVNMSG